jgi:two-component system, response regulator YesN
MRQFFPIFMNVGLPVLAGTVYLALARYVKHIGPLRTLVTGKLTYQGAFWGFLLFGSYLATRPLQILLGPHPMPLIVNCIREFIMIGLFSPAVTVAMMSLVLGNVSVPKILIRATFGLGLLIAILFVIFNIKAIGGTEVIFMMGSWPAYDGIWFHGVTGHASTLMAILFLLRLISPVLFIFGAGTLVLWHGLNYPIEKKMLYNNMPKKLFYTGAACYAFSLSMLSVGFLYLFVNIPNQWWIYYIGAFTAGLLETISLSLPLRRAVQIAEHGPNS